MFFIHGLLVDQVSLQGGVLNIQNLSVEFLKILVSQFGSVKGQPVSKDDLEFFGAEMATSVGDLA
jgi:hypothetical protein